MNIDDMLYSLRIAGCDESKELLGKLEAADAALKALSDKRSAATRAERPRLALQYGRVEAARERLRREIAKVVRERGWARTMPTDDYDGSYIGHEER